MLLLASGALPMEGFALRRKRSDFKREQVTNAYHQPTRARLAGPAGRQGSQAVALEVRRQASEEGLRINRRPVRRTGQVSGSTPDVGGDPRRTAVSRRQLKQKEE